MSSTSAFPNRRGKLRLQGGGYRGTGMVCTGGTPRNALGFTTDGIAKKGKKIECAGEKLLWPLTVHITLTKFFAYSVVKNIPSVLKEALGIFPEIFQYSLRCCWAREPPCSWTFGKPLPGVFSKLSGQAQAQTQFPAGNISVSLASILGCLLVREGKEQNSRDSNSLGKHLHLRQRGISQRIRYLLRQS